MAPDCPACNNTGLVWTTSWGDYRKHPCQCPRGIPQNDIIFGEQKSFSDYMTTAQQLTKGWEKWFSDESNAGRNLQGKPSIGIRKTPATNFCGNCRGSGSVMVVSAGNSAGSQSYVNRPKPYRYVTSRPFPCHCSCGQRIYHKMDTQFKDMYSFAQVTTAHDRGYCHYSATALYEFMAQCTQPELAEGEATA